MIDTFGYIELRGLHMACAGLSIGLFTLRAGLALAGVDWRRWRWLRVLPHANDSVLLLAAVALAVWSGQAPWSQAWLGAKVLALLAYIGLGRQALRAQQTQTARWCWSVLALASVLYIVGVAFTKSPWW